MTVCRRGGPLTEGDRDAVSQFAAFLAECEQRGRDAVLSDPAWGPYLAGSGPAPTLDRNRTGGDR